MKCYTEVMKPKNLAIAIVLTLFALPGAGHWYIKERKRSLIFMLPTILGVLWFCYDVFTTVKAVLMTARMKDHVAEALALSQDLTPDQTPYLTGLLILMILACADLAWIYLQKQKTDLSAEH